jgi:UDP-2,3-diacylglucosamine hydrolase
MRKQRQCMNDLKRAAKERQGPLAIICGGGSLPFAVADAALRQGRGIIMFALRGFADPARVEAYPHHWTRLGQYGRFRRIARQEGCREVVCVGSVVRPAVWRIWPDPAGLLLMSQIVFRGGDDRLLSSIMKAFEDRGFRPVGAHEVAPEILLPDGALGGFHPSGAQRQDIALGLSLLGAIGPFDVGQAAIVADNQVLAVEGAGGTDEMLAHVAELRRRGRITCNGGVLIKAPKPGQDRRVDLPAIGPHTVEGAERAGLGGIASIAGATIVAEAERIRQCADRARIFVVGLPEDGAGSNG